VDNDAVIKKLKQLTGRNRDIAEALINYKDAGYSSRDKRWHELVNLLLAEKPKTTTEVYDNGPRELFTAVYGRDTAELAGKAVSRLNNYVHSPSVWRRSFRTKNLEPYMERFVQIMDTLFFPWDEFDMVHDLSTPRRSDDDDDEKSRARRFPSGIYGDFIAVRIDERDQAVIGAVKEICLGDNNTRLVNDAIINGIIKSENSELHKLLGDLLLAAKLQEGLRQSILENADNGRVEAFIYLIKLVLDNDLLRFSSAIRALDVWMGLGESFEDKRVAAKLLTLAYTYLTDRKVLEASLDSRDVTEIYAALWALSVREMTDVTAPIEKLLAGEHYKKLAALYFLRQLENKALQFSVVSKIIRDYRGDDVDFLCLVMENYPLRQYYPWNNDEFFNDCKKEAYLEDPTIRDEQFEGLLHILQLIPAKGYSSSGKPFPWNTLSIEPKTAGAPLLTIAGFDRDEKKVDRLIDMTDKFDPDGRAALIRLFLGRPATARGRDFIFASLNDKSMSVRSQALKTVLGFSTPDKEKDPAEAVGDGERQVPPLNENEEKLIQDMLALKTGDIRQNSVKVLLALPGDRPLEAARTLLAGKNENKRLGALDMLVQLSKEGKISRSDAAKLIELMPAASEKEQVLIRSLTAEAPKYTKANGFGLYDPEYRPVFSPLEKDPRHTLASIFTITRERAEGLFNSLCTVIKEHKDYTYQIENYDGIQDSVLGTMEYVRPRAEVNNDTTMTVFEKYILQDLWRDWIKKEAFTFSELFYFMFAFTSGAYRGAYDPPYSEWAKALAEKYFHTRETDRFLHWYVKQEYGKLAMNILNIFWTEFPEEERFAVLYGAMVDLCRNIPQGDWKKPLYDENRNRYYREDSTIDNFSDTQEVSFLLGQLKNAVNDDECFKKYTAVCYELGRLTDMYYLNLTAVDIARGIGLGILKNDDLYRTMFLADSRNISGYAGKISWVSYKADAEKYPLLGTIATKAASRVIEIELERGDSATEVTKLAMAVKWHEGIDTLVKILTALGDETFHRGYYFGSTSTKKMTLSSLLKVSHPHKTDNAESLRTALAEKNISDKRLVEAAMYAPAWLDIVGDYLGWPGLKSAAWYFHAHINESFSAEKETEVARYSPISAEEFNNGAFDIDWFRDAWNTLGAERFDLVYDCAKYLTDGSNHRRAQLFADAVLGRLDKDVMEKEIHAKRSKDKLLSYSLIPLTPDAVIAANDAANATSGAATSGAASAGTASANAAAAASSSPVSEAVLREALKRYEFIQQFLKESKSFGAQRRESEAKACAIAQDNLARNAGFSDALRFAWRMETLKIEEVKAFFEPVTRGEYTVHVEVADDGSASLVCGKAGKKLASVPAALKKDEYVASCKAIAASLKQQFKRARASLERAMINRDVFEYGEIKTLMAHPVVAPLLQKLVFVTVQGAEGRAVTSGAFCELDGAKDNTLLRIAHPYDLYTLGTWLDCQKYAFEHKLCQPFKQIFRELYLLNEDEKRERTVSRRYAGHQVQPKKTAALLKSRGWTVDYEEGLQRVYYRENFYAAVYAAADWFSPADTEAPTLETVQFFSRRNLSGYDGKPLPLETIPPVIFSEVMRDVDLVVSVAHVGGVDPEASHSTIEMRAAIVRELLSLLHISNAAVEDRHAKIKGTLGEYTVHLGSAQVHKMGRGAVNILAVPSQHRGRVFLPFADEDPRTAEVMSKIIMLADDTSIKDPAILAQIE
jgi:hypothetical protein